MSYRIFDLDNCIANDGWRIKYIVQKDTAIVLDDDNSYSCKPVFDYHDYNSLSPFDRAENTHLLYGVKPIVIFTSRPERYRLITEKWLEVNNITYRSLHMRPDSLNASAAKLKSAMLNALFSEYGPATIAYDDDDDVVRMYQQNGIRAVRAWIHNRKYP